MNHPELANKIMKAIIENHGDSPLRISKYLHEDQELVASLMEDIENEYPEWFGPQGKGFGNNEYRLTIRASYLDAITQFLQGGGFD